MTDPAALAPAQPAAPRIVLLDRPDAAHRRWESFVRHLDRPAAPTSALLRTWLGGRSVEVSDPQARRGAGRQYRVVTLTTPDAGDELPLCHISAVVDLALLSSGSRDALLRSGRPLSTTLLRAGAVRERTTATVLDPDPDAPGDAGLRVRGTFRLPTEDGRVVATVEEWFTGYVLQLAGAGHRVAVEPTDAPEPIDEPIDEPVVALVPQPRAPVAPRWRRRPAREDGAAGGRRPVHLVRTPDPGTTSEIPDRRGARQW